MLEAVGEWGLKVDSVRASVLDVRIEARFDRDLRRGCWASSGTEQL